MVANWSRPFPNRLANPAAGAGVMEAIKGNIGAIPDFTDAVAFSPQPPASKDIAKGSMDGRMIYPYKSAPFTSKRLRSI